MRPRHSRRAFELPGLFGLLCAPSRRTTLLHRWLSIWQACRNPRFSCRWALACDGTELLQASGAGWACCCPSAWTSGRRRNCSVLEHQLLVRSPKAKRSGTPLCSQRCCSDHCSCVSLVVTGYPRRTRLLSTAICSGVSRVPLILHSNADYPHWLLVCS